MDWIKLAEYKIEYLGSSWLSNYEIFKEALAPLY
jgi:hypothetical protein